MTKSMTALPCFVNKLTPTQIYTLSLHDALPIYCPERIDDRACGCHGKTGRFFRYFLPRSERSEEHTSELQSRRDLVCRLLLEKKNQVVTLLPISQSAEWLARIGVQ